MAVWRLGARGWQGGSLCFVRNGTVDCHVNSFEDTTLVGPDAHEWSF